MDAVLMDLFGTGRGFESPWVHSQIISNATKRKGCLSMVPQKETPKVYAGSAVVQAVAKETGLPKDQVKKTLETFFAFTKKVVGEGDKVRILEFGTFQNKHRNEQTGRNPRTGETVTVPALDRLAFHGTYKY